MKAHCPRAIEGGHSFRVFPVYARRSRRNNRDAQGTRAECQAKRTFGLGRMNGIFPRFPFRISTPRARAPPGSPLQFSSARPRRPRTAALPGTQCALDSDAL